MSNPSGKKGWAGEAPVLTRLKDRGFFRAFRLRTQGSKDKGDIGGIDGVAIEVKNVGTYDIPGWMRELAVEKRNALAETGALVVKPRGVGETRVGEWWTILTLDDYIDLLAKAGYGPYEDPHERPSPKPRR